MGVRDSSSVFRSTPRSVLRRTRRNGGDRRWSGDIYRSSGRYLSEDFVNREGSVGMVVVLAEAQFARGPTVTTSRACLLSSFSRSCSSFLIAFILYSYRLYKRRRLVSPPSARRTR